MQPRTPRPAGGGEDRCRGRGVGHLRTRHKGWGCWANPEPGGASAPSSRGAERRDSERQPGAWLRGFFLVYPLG